MKSKIQLRQTRKKRIRKTISGQESRPRVTVFRSNMHIYAQAIDDVNGVTLASASDKGIKKGSKIDRASKVGEELAAQLVKKKINNVIFDRNGYKYHGRVKALADGARNGGLDF